MPNFIDQTGQIVFIKNGPQRIVSLVPSQTELLSDLGLDKEVIGITKFCVHPHHWLETKTRVGGTKQLDIKLIRSLQPDLIIGNKEENVKEQVEELRSEFPIWISDVISSETAIEMMLQVGLLTGRVKESNQIVEEIIKRFNDLPLMRNRPSAIYLIWQKPFMTVGGDTFIHSMMNIAGFDNLLADQNRNPTISLEEMQNLQPNYLLLSSEPYPFREKHIETFQKALPNSEVKLVDGEMFSWYGSRMMKAADYFRGLAIK